MSIVEERWRANRLLKERAKRDKFKIAEEKKSELAKIKAEGMATGRLQQREITANEDKAREQRVNKFYSERRYGSLLEARGRDDPMVQEAAQRLGYDSGGIATPKRAGALKKLGTTTTGGAESPKYKDVTDRMRFANEVGEEAMTKLTKEYGGRPSAKTESLAAAGDPFAKSAPTDKIYEGTVQRGGESYRAFSNTQKQGYNEYKPSRLAPPTEAKPWDMEDNPNYGFMREMGARQRQTEQYKPIPESIGNQQRIKPERSKTFTPPEYQVEKRKPILKTFDNFMKKKLGIKGKIKGTPLQFGTQQETRILEELGLLKSRIY